MTFFRVIFFSSNHRRKVLSSHMKFMINRLITTRRRAPYEAIRAEKIGFQGLIQTLDSLTSASENLQPRGNAQIILLSIENFSFMSYLFYWEEILGQINLFQKKLQEPGIGLDVCDPHECNEKFSITKTRTGWDLNRLIKVKQCARKLLITF